MPTCGCTTPCNCLVDEDGYRSGHPEQGRRSTVVTGRGVAEDPYVIEFQLSGEYRPPSAEIRMTGVVIANNFGTVEFFTPENVQWESPNNNVYTAVSFYFMLTGSFHAVGASASFAANATGTRHLDIFGIDEEGNGHFVAGNTQHGNATRPTICATSTLTAGLFTPTPAVLANFSNQRINVFNIGVRQTSGVALTTNLKFWMTTI